jgi:hypothetical protein
MLGQKAFEAEKPSGAADALRGFVAIRAIGCEKLRGGLAFVQVSLRRSRARGTQRQRADRQPHTAR